MSTSISFKYHEDGVLSDGFKLPDIPVMSLLIVRHDLRKAAIVEGLVDTGFDGALYSNFELAEFLLNLKPVSTRQMEAPGHLIKGEVFELPVFLISEEANRIIDLGLNEIFVPLSAPDLVEDIVIGRKMLNKLKIILNGPHAKLTVEKG
ncbi:MAG: hypothetical protein ACP5PQ_04850 [Thermoproteota archaeon]